MAGIAAAVAGGDITTTEAVELAKLVEALVKVIEVAEFEERLKYLKVKASS